MAEGVLKGSSSRCAPLGIWQTDTDELWQEADDRRRWIIASGLLDEIVMPEITWRSRSRERPG